MLYNILDKDNSFNLEDLVPRDIISLGTKKQKGIFYSPKKTCIW
jgi:hypothetical protein